jgi:hypothetical protein
VISRALSLLLALAPTSGKVPLPPDGGSISVPTIAALGDVETVVSSGSFNGESVEIRIRLVARRNLLLDTRFANSWKLLSLKSLRTCSSGSEVPFTTPALGTLAPPAPGDQVVLTKGDAIEKQVRLPLFWPKQKLAECVVALIEIRQPDFSSGAIHLLASVSIQVGPENMLPTQKR